ncbi:MAG TPA: 3-phosphoshikimate 1-carboxyvinyltransferase [Thermoflexales bacterium]|nr:3-phosphoshikimate 1-carboxyvinyltransferase [Thermoflexales bacterium]HQX74919.1 3-phosphoshikimate 1-carboxyvinyltransferase [Thermoflexales bacterium]HQZ21123.1 3-phosphoshikimate 1-carboxyvinyltransferase [Thermoflexales bacterium]HRA01048.1 3-phosphoshikimate 1-carboxyvinyltransferase [Thermoflexales bacterium]
MNYTITPAKKISGRLRVPGDRSITVRAVLLGSIASGTSIIQDHLVCDDTRAAIGCMRDLGVKIIERGAPSRLEIDGVGLNGLQPAAHTLQCGSSGTTMRLLAGLMAGQSFGSALDGSEQLRRRPMRRITEPLRAMGATISDQEGCAPIAISATPLAGIDYDMPVASAQIKSALLLAGLYAEGITSVREPAPTRDHTERMLAACGADVRVDAATRTVSIQSPTEPLNALNLRVPADYSSAAFFAAAGLIHQNAALVLDDVGVNPTRAGFSDALLAMGANLRHPAPRTEGGEPVTDLMCDSSQLNAIEVSGDLVARMIDEFPIFAVVATQARGRTVVRDAQELRVKESNRIDGLVAELQKMGAKIQATPDGFVIDGPTRLRGAVVNGLGDHRVAMALAVAALVAEGDTTIEGAECVSKTYPQFFSHLERVVSR